MAVPSSLIPELEEVVQHASPERRSETLRRITDLFVGRASEYNEDHVQLFDDVFGWLIDEIESKARAELSHSLAPVDNAPKGVVRTLANDDDIEIARPLLERSRRLPESELVQIASTKGQAHLLAISGRNELAETVTDVLVKRGDREVYHTVAENRGARISDQGFSRLVQQAELDGALAEKVGARSDIPPRQFRELLLRATEVVQKRLLASAKPDTQSEIRRILAKVSDEIGAKTTQRDYTEALNTVEGLHAEGKLDETALVDFAEAGRFEEMTAALAKLCGVPIEVVDRLMSGSRPDPVLILCKAAGWQWPTVKAILKARPEGQKASSQALDAAHENFDQLTVATAQRVVRFWQIRQGDEAP